MKFRDLDSVTCVSHEGWRVIKLRTRGVFLTHQSRTSSLATVSLRRIESKYARS